MRNRLVFFFVFFVCCPVNAFTQIKEFTAAGIEKTFAKVNDTLHASRYETSNLEYNIFLSEIAKKDSNLYKEYSVDSLRWLETPYIEAMVKHYHRHQGFSDYPVVCVSYESVIAYCNWLSEIYNNDKGRKYKKVSFVLPSEKEWELAAKGTNKNAIYAWGTNSIRDTRKNWQGVFMANFFHFGDAGTVTDSSGNNPVLKPEVVPDIPDTGLRDMSFYTAQVASFFPNSLGIYNQSGNVAEMTSQKGLTKGGSWHSLGGEITIAYRLYFYEPSAEVGFRVFMKIIEP